MNIILFSGENNIGYYFKGSIIMKRDLLTILCMTLVCASVMLGIMGIYRLVGAKSARSFSGRGFDGTAFKVSGINYTV